MAILLCRRICIATRGWTSRAASSDPQDLRVPWTVIRRTLALLMRRSKLRVKLRGSIGVTGCPVTGAESFRARHWLDRIWAGRQRQEAGMAEEVTARVSRYVNDGSDQDLRRLLRGAELVAEPARTAFRG